MTSRPAADGKERDVTVLKAHSADPSGRWHLLGDHLASTGEIAAAFGAAFGSSVAAGLVGRVHDLGKADPSWQEYLRVVAAGGKHPMIDHKSAGAMLLAGWRLGTLAPVVLGHHGGLSDLTRCRTVLAKPATAGQAHALSLAALFGLSQPDRVGVVPTAVLPADQYDLAGKRRLEFWLRMVFSALIDADRLDTQSHFDPSRPVSLSSVGLETLNEQFEAARPSAVRSRIGDPIADARNHVYEEVTSHAPEPKGWYELTAPTGAGKTLSALGFALKHAQAHGMRRVVMAVPFISVTEQVADVYRSVLDPAGTDSIVLEHHSGRNAQSEAQTGRGLWSRLAVENWDATIVVTTTVQLLESLFGNKPTSVRKLHRLAQSVIVLDEVQSIPWRLLEPTLDVLRELVRNYGCSVVMSTATQPPFELIGALDGVERRSLLDEKWFLDFRRVRTVNDPVQRSWTEIADQVSSSADAHAGQCLVILNTIRDARELSAHLVGRQGLSHLSTRLCPAHRRDVLRRVTAQLAAGEPCLVVSTQLIEAGIDIDFPIAYRAIAPMTAIAQAAGRVNRHGTRPTGILHVFDPIEGKVPPKEYEIGRNVARDLMRSGADPLDPADLRRYFDRFLDATRDLLDEEKIQSEREHLNFEQVADRYRMIVDDTESVLVNYGSFVSTDVVVPKEPGERRRLARRLQQYMVNIRTKEFETARTNGLVLDLGGEFFAWLGPYDQTVGLGTERSTEALIW